MNTRPQPKALVITFITVSPRMVASITRTRISIVYKLYIFKN